MIRYLNAGTVNYPFHPHGSDERVVNKDGQPLQGAGGEDLSFLKYDIDVRPGQSIDALMDWRDVEQWNADDQPDPDAAARRSPTSCWSGTDTWFSESGYLGQKSALPSNITTTTSAASTTTWPTATRCSRPPTTARPSAG